MRALHVMPDVEGPEGELHTHDYRIEVVVGDALKVASWLPAADLVFLDPPYAMVEESHARVLRALAALVESHLADDGIAVLHVPHGALAAEELAPARARVRRYGTNDLWYVERGAG